MRFRLTLILIGALLIVATFTFPLWQPGSITPSQGGAAVEGFAGIPAEMQAMFRILPQIQQDTYRAVSAQDPVKGAAMVVAALSPRQPAPEDDAELPEMTSPVIAAVGRFERVDPVRWAQGEVTIFTQVDNPPLVRFENFSVAKGPDLRVFLSVSAQPRNAGEMRAEDAAIDLGPLKGDDGAQNFPLPQPADVSRFRSVVLYSPSLDMIYSYAPLFVRS